MPSDPPPHLQTGDFFADTTFSELSLPGVDLSGKEFERCTFRRCKLPESRWVRAKLVDCAFEDCDLGRMVPKQLGLRRVTFRGSKLMGIDWSEVAVRPDVTFEGCDLRYASFVSLRLPKTRFVRCGMREANLLEVDLTEADFTESDLTGSTIAGCALTRVDFSRATGVFFDPRGNRVKGARISLGAGLAILESLGLEVPGADP
jgi:uncharacterized protein YjbI with pentapeptide repeats